MMMHSAPVCAVALCVAMSESALRVVTRPVRSATKSILNG